MNRTLIFLFVCLCLIMISLADVPILGKPSELKLRNEKEVININHFNSSSSVADEFINNKSPNKSLYIEIYGYEGCEIFKRAKQIVNLMTNNISITEVAKSKWKNKLSELKAKKNMDEQHKTSPVIFVNGEFIGGLDKFKKRFDL